MSADFLANGLFVFIAFTWVMYLTQELFISGSSALNWTLAKNDTERKAIQEASGLHWDGIEVWFIAALVVTLGAFPVVFATTFTFLYVVFFLLLYALITRGIVIETIYKLDHPKWIRYNAIAWAISSAMILFFFGVYITSTFYGLPLENGELTGSFLSIFNVTTISGGLLFFTLGIVGGAAWIALTTTAELRDKALRLVKKSGLFIIVVVLLLLIYMGFNVLDNSMFTGELFSRSFVFFLFPLLNVVAAFGVAYAGYKGNALMLFVFALSTMALFVITGFVGIYPTILPSRIDTASGLLIFDVVTQAQGGTIIFFVMLFAYPLIIGYQTWKYRRFVKKLASEK